MNSYTIILILIASALPAAVLLYFVIKWYKQPLKNCLLCKKPLKKNMPYTGYCTTCNPKNKIIADKEKIELLKGKLPKKIQKEIFYPDSDFYAYSYKDPIAGLHYMAIKIFEHLDIEPNGCIIDFYDEKDFEQRTNKDTAGFYTKIEKDGKKVEVIMINSKNKNNPLAVGAILAHEMMHLYLYRLDIELEDVQENELLTDLATIQAGLGILIINGMHHSSKWHLTLILLFLGMLYTSSEQRAFGYLKPHDYGKHFITYLKEKNIQPTTVLGYINPTSRNFISYGMVFKSKNPTPYIALLEKKHIKGTATKAAIAGGAIILILSWQFLPDMKGNNLKQSIDSCKQEVVSLETKIKDDNSQLDNLESLLEQYDKIHNAAKYNELVDPYNNLLLKTKLEIQTYNSKLQDCNAKINEYNK